MSTLKNSLERAWDNGFFYGLRQGRFNNDQYLELKRAFDSSLAETLDLSDNRLISLLWFIPLFISWQAERLENNGVPQSTVTEISDYFYNQCERILGLP